MAAKKKAVRRKKAAPASVGVPVTHRGVAHGVALVTAHAAEEGAEPDWRALALSGLTLVVYMGMQRIDELRDKLVAAGQSPATPVAIVANATRSDQRALHTTVARMAEDVGVLQDTENLLAIMQNGAFWKLADQLTAA